MRRWNWIALALACCAFLAACSNQGRSGATTVDPMACRSTCKDRYADCMLVCEEHADDDMCGTECIDKMESCKRRCG